MKLDKSDIKNIIELTNSSVCSSACTDSDPSIGNVSTDGSMSADIHDTKVDSDKVTSTKSPVLDTILRKESLTFTNV